MYFDLFKIGYPNVGKSSTINAILKMKKVPVSATPGRTKHFQVSFLYKYNKCYTKDEESTGICHAW